MEFVMRGVLSVYDFRHAYVVWFARDEIYDLERVGQPNQWALELGKQAVVKSFSAPKAFALCCEGDAWNDGKVDL